MKKLSLFAIAALASVSSGYAPTPAPPAGTPAEAWSDVGAWPTPEAARLLGQVTGLDIDGYGRIYAFHRADRKWIEPFPSAPIAGETVTLLDPSGNRLGGWGAGLFIMPHGLSLDRDGNVWVTDVGAHQVRKFTPDGRLTLTLGEWRKAGNDSSHFNRPTDVAFGPDGTVFISDGYQNTRVIKFSPDGRYLGEWGKAGKGAGQFDLPHGIAVDGNGQIYVADRNNYRVQIFDQAGRYLTEWGKELLGDPYGVSVARDGTIYVIDGGFQPDKTRARIIRLLPDGKVIATLVAAQATNEDVLGHDIAVAEDGSVYIADAWANRIRKLQARR